MRGRNKSKIRATTSRGQPVASSGICQRTLRTRSVRITFSPPSASVIFCDCVCACIWTALNAHSMPHKRISFRERPAESRIELFASGISSRRRRNARRKCEPYRLRHSPPEYRYGSGARECTHLTSSVDLVCARMRICSTDGRGRCITFLLEIVEQRRGRCTRLSACLLALLLSSKSESHANCGRLKSS